MHGLIGTCGTGCMMTELGCMGMGGAPWIIDGGSGIPVVMGDPGLCAVTGGDVFCSMVDTSEP